MLFVYIFYNVVYKMFEENFFLYLRIFGVSFKVFNIGWEGVILTLIWESRLDDCDVRVEFLEVLNLKVEKDLGWCFNIFFFELLIVCRY